MVARAGGYYGKAFKGFRGVTQGDPLSPTIFNVVVDVVVWHWAEETAGSADGQGRCGREGRHKNDLFYADDGMIASSEPGCLQGAFRTLLGMFDWVGLRTNVRNMVRMFFCPCQAAVNNLEAAYEWRTMGVELSYQERQQVRVQCSECGKEMELGSISYHLHKNHGKATEGIWNWGTTPTGRDPYTYKTSLPTTGPRGTAPSRGVRDGRQCGRQYETTFSTGMSGIPRLYWSRATSSTHSAPVSICWCPGGN